MHRSTAATVNSSLPMWARHAMRRLRKAEPHNRSAAAATERQLPESPCSPKPSQHSLYMHLYHKLCTIVSRRSHSRHAAPNALAYSQRGEGKQLPGPFGPPFETLARTLFGSRALQVACVSLPRP